MLAVWLCETQCTVLHAKNSRCPFSPQYGNFMITLITRWTQKQLLWSVLSLITLPEKKKSVLFLEFWNSCRNCSTVNEWSIVAKTVTRDEYVNFKWLGRSIEDILFSMNSLQISLMEIIYYTMLKSASQKQNYWHFGPIKVCKLTCSR